MILHLIFISILVGPDKKIKCTKTQFACKNNNQCIDILEYCDNKRDCNDGSDELNCPIVSCLDKHNDCLQWSADGYCKSSYKYMMENCKKSCDFCHTTTYTKTSTSYTTITTTSTTYTTITKTRTSYTTITTTSTTYTNITTTSTTYTTITTLTNTKAINKIDYQNNTVTNKSKRNSTSIIIIVILVICILSLIIFIIKRKSESIVYINDINENNINENNQPDNFLQNENNQPDNFLQNENINNNKPIIMDSVYNSMYCDADNEYLVPVVQNYNYIEEGDYEEIV